MNPFSKLPVLALLGGVLLGAAIFLLVRPSVPLLSRGVDFGPFEPWQMKQRLFIFVAAAGGLGGSGLAWIGYRVYDGRDSCAWVSALIFAATVGGVTTGLVASLLPETSGEMLMIMGVASPCALVGCALCWCVIDTSSIGLF